MPLNYYKFLEGENLSFLNRHQDQTNLKRVSQTHPTSAANTAISLLLPGSQQYDNFTIVVDSDTPEGHDHARGNQEGVASIEPSHLMQGNLMAAVMETSEKVDALKEQLEAVVRPPCVCEPNEFKLSCTFYAARLFSH